MKYWKCGIGPNEIFIEWNRSQMKCKRSQIGFAHCGIGPVIGTIPSIPIPLANFGMELTPKSNPSLWICPTAPTPIQQSEDDSNVCFEISWKSWEPGVTSGFFGLLVKPEWREWNSNTWNPLKYPQFRAIGVEVDSPILPVELELEHSKSQFQRIRIGVLNCELTPILFQWLDSRPIIESCDSQVVLMFATNVI